MMKSSLFLFLLLAGCMVGPDHETPHVCLPCEYEQGPMETQEMDLTVFWEQFEDLMLTELIEEALCCNLDLRIALHRIEEVRAQYRIDSSLLYPQIQANFIAARARRSENLSTDVIESPASVTDILPTDFSGPLIQNFFQLGFDAAWEIDLWGKNRRRSQAARFDFETTQEEALEVQVALVSDVARSYIDIRTLQGQIKTQIEQIERNEELLDLAQSRYDAGLTSYLDVTRAQSELELQVAALPPYEENLKKALFGLAVLLGQNPEGFCIGKGEIPRASGKIPDTLPSSLLCQRPDIRRADRELAAATSRIGLAKAELLPSFSLLGTFGTQAGKFEDLFVWPSRYWTIGPAMLWNLFTGGRLVGQVQVANQRQKQAVLAYERAVLNALQDVEGQLVGYFKEKQRLGALHDRLDAITLTRDLTFDRYLSGLISLDDVLRVERDLYLSRLEGIESEGTLMVQLIGLYKALGGGWQCYPTL